MRKGYTWVGKEAQQAFIWIRDGSCEAGRDGY